MCLNMSFVTLHSTKGFQIQTLVVDDLPHLLWSCTFLLSNWQSSGATRNHNSLSSVSLSLH